MRALALLVLVSVTACDTPPAQDPLRLINATLAELHLPGAVEGAMSRDSTWQIIVDRSEPTGRLLLLRQVAALVVPDGPLEVTAPLTYFRFENQLWHQYYGTAASVRLADASVAALRSELSDTTRVYFYRVESLDVVSPARDSAAVVRLLRNAVAGLDRDVVRLRREGFLTMDAEP